MAEDTHNNSTSAHPTGDKPSSDTSGAQSTKKTTVEKVKEHASTLVGEATDAARNAANEGKNKASEALETVSKVVENAAQMVEDKVGPTYGNYARKAATGVSSFAESLQNKDIDELIDDTRNFVRKQPIIAVGAALAIGFALTRLIKLGVDNDNQRDI